MVNEEHVKILEQGVEAWNKWRDENPGIKPDLAMVNLEGANLTGANLMSANLYGAHLKGAELGDADLQAAHLIHAKLEGANLRRANLRAANLRGASLKGAVLACTVLKGTILTESDIRGASFWNAKLEKTNLFEVRFDRSTDCRGVSSDFNASPLFKRFVADQQYLAEFREKHRFVYCLWWLFADCGRSILLWAAWSIVFATIFAYIFFGLGPGAFFVDRLPWSFETMLYYSVVTFTTLGFGDVTPVTNAAAWWVMAEVIAGYVMLGGLISIFANKLARRS